MLSNVWIWSDASRSIRPISFSVFIRWSIYHKNVRRFLRNWKHSIRGDLRTYPRHTITTFTAFLACVFIIHDIFEHIIVVNSCPSRTMTRPLYWWHVLRSTAQDVVYGTLVFLNSLAYRKPSRSVSLENHPSRTWEWRCHSPFNSFLETWRQGHQRSSPVSNNYRSGSSTGWKMKCMSRCLPTRVSMGFHVTWLHKCPWRLLL